MQETIAILDFGSQYCQLIARRVRENHVFSVLCRPDITPAELRELGAVGLIFSGGPSSVYEKDAPRCDPAILEMGLPVLGICYGMQIGCELLGGRVHPAATREYGRTRLHIRDADLLLAHVPADTSVWMSHGDVVNELPADFETLAATPSCRFAAVRHRSRPFYGVQFHPEVTHTPYGGQIIRNFLYEICGCGGRWQVGNFIEEAVEDVRRRVREDQRVICGLSGGVDSSVTAALLHRAVGDRLVCIFVDNGLLRKNETEFVAATFRDHFRIDLHVVQAAARFLDALAGVTDPQEKRRIIGREFIEVFKAEAKTIPNAHFKLHHNVGGLPAELGFELIEPLRSLFKDEVRQVGEHLGLPEELVWRHPFPGPGLAVRIVGEITPERLAILREADEILLDEIQAAGWYRKIAQALVVLLPIRSVGVMGDGRSYAGQHVAALRLIESRDYMTADWVRIDYEVLARISSRIINEVKGINRVVYDVSSKPPATIEWE